MQKDTVIHLNTTKSELPKVQVPVGIYGKIYHKSVEENWEKNLTQVERNDLKVKRSKHLLGTWWRLDLKCNFVNRGEYFLSIYHRQIINKKPDISLMSGKYLLVSELRDFIANLDSRRRVYIGDLKLMGDI